jgi:arginyl-tRNA synthetase
MVEYSSPNTNKPLHLGHVRNNLLHLLQDYQTGKKVYKTQIINDSGIYVNQCWLGRNLEMEKPELAGLKDKLVLLCGFWTKPIK